MTDEKTPTDETPADEIRRALEEAAPVSPMAPAPENDGPTPPIGADPEVLALKEGAEFPLNDYGNGQRLVAYFGADIRYVPRLGWLRWDGRRWASDEDEIRVRADAQRIAARIEAEIPHLALEEWQRGALDQWRAAKARFEELEVRENLGEGEKAELRTLRGLRGAGLEAERALGKKRAGHRAHARASGNSGRIKNMLIEAIPDLAIDTDDLNLNPLQLACENGVLEFYREELPADPDAASYRPPPRIGRVRVLKPDRAQMITKIARANYAPSAPRPLFDAFLTRILPNAVTRSFVQRYFGYCLTGDTGEQKLLFLYGQGRNGKSTLVDICARILSDYSTTIPIETLTGSEQRKGSDATPDLVRLPGARFVRSSEPERGQKMKESLIKALTGGEPLMIRRMAQEFVEVHPEFKLIISGNYKPEIHGSDDGIWRRILLVPFLEQILKGEVDHDLPARLWEERDGILSWMVEGCLDWLAQGLNPPREVLSATEDYRADSDEVRTFLKTACLITGHAEDKVPARDLNDAFNGWQRVNGQPVWRTKATSTSLKKATEGVRGPAGECFRHGKDSTSVYFGIRLTEEAETWRIEYKNAREG